MFWNIAQKRGSKHPDHVTMTKQAVVYFTPVMAGGVPAASAHSWDKDSHFGITTLIYAEPCNDWIHVFDITDSVYHTCKTKQYLSLII